MTKIPSESSAEIERQAFDLGFVAPCRFGGACRPLLRARVRQSQMRAA
ncbi:MAG: hypothetical protein LC742_09990 [Acidobacteria bacterium]|nr:hypothetical protein [Acidobacteriota bacterium]